MDLSSILLRYRTAQAIVGSVYPRLRSRNLEEWPTLLEKANRHPFDFLEWIGMAAGIVLVTSILRPLATSSAPPLFNFATQFVLSLPLLTLVIGPFLIRRMGRGLTRLLDESNGAGSHRPTTGTNDG
jgi:hypothetical protein